MERMPKKNGKEELANTKIDKVIKLDLLNPKRQNSQNKLNK